MAYACHYEKEWQAYETLGDLSPKFTDLQKKENEESHKLNVK